MKHYIFSKEEKGKRKKDSHIVEKVVSAGALAVAAGGFALGYINGHSNTMLQVREKMPGVVIKAGSFGAYSLLDAMEALPDCNDVAVLLEKAEEIFLKNEWVQDMSIVVDKIKG